MLHKLLSLSGLVAVLGVLPSGGAEAAPQWECRIHQKVNVHKPNQGAAIQHDFVHIHDTSDARAWMNLKDESGKLVPMGDRAIPTFKALRAVEEGRDDHNLRRYMGGGTLTYTAYYAEHDKIPDRIWYLSRMDYCLGFVEVKKFMHEGKWAWSFTLPIAEGGAHPLFERRVLQNKDRALLLCVTSSVPIYAPTLTAGPARGQENTICSLPGSTPGTTRIDEVSRDSLTTWVMIVAILNESSRSTAAPSTARRVTPPSAPPANPVGGVPQGNVTRFTIQR